MKNDCQILTDQKNRQAEMTQLVEDLRAEQRKREIQAAHGADVRTDPHRPGAIIPKHYTYFGCYYLGSYPTVGDIQRLRDLRVRARMHLDSQEAQDYGSLPYGEFGKCGVCGARFADGVIWMHEETKDLVHMGHDCARKYDFVLNDPTWYALKEARERHTKAVKTAARRSKVIEKLKAAYPDLDQALATNHYIARSVKAQWDRGDVITEKQIAVVYKVWNESKAREAAKAAQESAPKATAPTGRQTIRGVIVSRKSQETDFGTRTVMTVKVQTPEGEWLCWGTVPSQLVEAIRGDEVEFTATLEAGREPHFAFFKRPTCGKIHGFPQAFCKFWGELGGCLPLAG